MALHWHSIITSSPLHRRRLSILQANNHLKQLAIESLAQYASNCRYFLIVCPSSIHHNTQLSCDPVTYSKRGWCRLEQWARLNGGGIEGMYITRGEHVIEQIEEQEGCLMSGWLHESMMVVDGDSS